jgi:hypothetical protein
VFTIKPSLTQLHEAVETIFGDISYTKMHEIECFSRQTSGISKMEKTLENIKRSTHTFIFVKCLENLDLVLHHAKEIGLTSSEFRWVFPGVAEVKGLSTKLPRNVIAIDLPGANDHYQPTGGVNALFLADALGVLQKTLSNNAEELFGQRKWTYAELTTFLRRYEVKKKFVHVSKTLPQLEALCIEI